MSAFVDTNVLVYAADEVRPVPRKTRIARELLLQSDLHLSVQVLNEFTVNARHAKKLKLSREVEAEWIDRWLLFPVHAVTLAHYEIARGIHLRFGLSHWDSLIMASAKAAGCDLIYSEDLSDDQDYDGIRVVNPFA